MKLSHPALTALTLSLAGVAFAAYPMLRGYADETGLSGADLYARPAWLWAHVLGMVGFALTAAGLAGIDRWAHRLALVGAALVLPYYGAEAYGLHALGQRALETQDAGIIAAADMFRYASVPATLFALGLAAWAAVGVRLWLRLRHGISGLRVGLFVVGLAMLTYLPQFYLSPGARITHGVVLGIGLVALGTSVVMPRPATRAAVTA